MRFGHRRLDGSDGSMGRSCHSSGRGGASAASARCSGAQSFGPARVRHVGDEPPAALAFFAVARSSTRARPSRRSLPPGSSSTSRDDEQHRQFGRVLLEEQPAGPPPAARRDVRAERRADLLACAAASSARFTSSRTAIRRSQRSSERRSSISASTLCREAPPCEPTPRARRAGSRQSSSAVNGRIGASRRASPSAMMYIAVCADRRSRDAAANVYRRSFGHVVVERAQVDRHELVDASGRSPGKS